MGREEQWGKVKVVENTCGLLAWIKEEVHSEGNLFILPVFLSSPSLGYTNNRIRMRILMVPSVHSIHELHVWELVDSLTISSVHLVVQQGAHVTEVGHSWSCPPQGFKRR